MLARRERETTMNRHSTLLTSTWCVLVLLGCGGPEKPSETAIAAPAPAPAAPSAAAAPVAAPAVAAPAPAPPEDPVALFNGKDMTGFVHVLDSKWVF